MISIAMTTYNGEKYIKEQLESILYQNIYIDEIIVCDDGSTDHTIDIIQSYHDSRIVICKNKKRLGYIQNFYKAIGLTSGDYIFLSDQDDIWEANKIRTLMSVMKERFCQAVCSGCSIIDGEGHLVEKQHRPIFFPKKKEINKIERIKFRKLLYKNIAQGCTFGFTKKVKEVYLQIRNFDVIHDWQLMLIASAMGKALYVNEPMIRYRVHSSNAVAFSINIRMHKPSKKPTMVRFISKLSQNTYLKQTDKYWAYFIYYFRIPFIFTMLNKIFESKKQR